MSDEEDKEKEKTTGLRFHWSNLMLHPCIRPMVSTVACYKEKRKSKDSGGLKGRANILFTTECCRNQKEGKNK